MTAEAVAAGLERIRDLAREVRDVDPTLRRAAALVAQLACRDLGIPTVRVRWLSPETCCYRGMTYPERPGEVWVKVQPLAATIETVAHECRHAWQLQPEALRWAMKGLESYDEREADAHAYGLAIRGQLTEGK